MKIVILAGGLGTRLRSAIPDNIPKPMAIINGKPYLEYMIHYLWTCKVEEIILAVGYKYDVIHEYFGDHYYHMPISYSIEDKPLGTGGAIKKSLASLDKNELVAVVNGDTYFPIDIERFVRNHKEVNADISIALKHLQERMRFGTVTLSNGWVQKLNDKRDRGPGLINGGWYAMSGNIFDIVETPQMFSFEDFISDSMLLLKVAGLEFGERFIDMGIPEDYKELKTIGLGSIDR